MAIFIKENEFKQEMIECLERYNEITKDIDPADDKALSIKLWEAGEYPTKARALKAIEQPRRNEALSAKALAALMLLAERTIKPGQYKNQENRYDCIAQANMDIIKYWTSYNPENGKAFAYFTTMINMAKAKFWKDMYPLKFRGKMVSISGSGATSGENNMGGIHTL